MGGSVICAYITYKRTGEIYWATVLVSIGIGFILSFYVFEIMEILFDKKVHKSSIFIIGMNFIKQYLLTNYISIVNVIKKRFYIILLYYIVVRK